MLKKVMRSSLIFSALTLTTVSFAQTPTMKNCYDECLGTESCLCIDIKNEAGIPAKLVEETVNFTPAYCKLGIDQPAQQVMPYGSTSLNAIAGAKCGVITGTLTYKEADGTSCSFSFEKEWTDDIGEHCVFTHLGQWDPNKCNLEKTYDLLHLCELQFTLSPT